MSAFATCRGFIKSEISLGFKRTVQKCHPIIFSRYGNRAYLEKSITKPALTSRKATNIPPSTLSYHWDTAIPTHAQLRQAERFFLSHPPVLLHSTDKFRTVNPGTAPEVAFLGRSNVGKSSLLNALMGSKICHTSSKPGRTKTMNFFAVGGEDNVGSPGKIVVLDMPGYGKGSRDEWGEEIMKYLVGRKQFKRAFLLVDALHGLKQSDEKFLSQFRQNGISHQVILSKVDRILLPGPKSPSEARLKTYSANLRKTFEELRTKIQPGNLDGPEGLGELISCSAEKSLERGRRPGMNQVRWAVLAATGLNNQNQKIQPSDIISDDIESYSESSRNSMMPVDSMTTNYFAYR